MSPETEANTQALEYQSTVILHRFNFIEEKNPSQGLILNQQSASLPLEVAGLNTQVISADSATESLAGSYSQLQLEMFFASALSDYRFLTKPKDYPIQNIRQFLTPGENETYERYSRLQEREYTVRNIARETITEDHIISVLDQFPEEDDTKLYSALISLFNEAELLRKDGSLNLSERGWVNQQNKLVYRVYGYEDSMMEMLRERDTESLENQPTIPIPAVNVK